MKQPILSFRWQQLSILTLVITFAVVGCDQSVLNPVPPPNPGNKPTAVSSEKFGLMKITIRGIGSGQMSADAKPVRPRMAFDLARPTNSAGLTLDGDGDYAGVPDAAALDLTNGFTIEAWVKPAALGSGFQRILGKAGAYGFGFNASTLRFTTYGIKDYDFSYSLAAGQWTHLAVVFDTGNDATFYVNGDKVGTVTGPDPANKSKKALYIGGVAGAAEFLNGNIDELRIWNIARTQTQIKNNMNKEIDPTTHDHLIAYYRLIQPRTGSFLIWPAVMMPP